MPATRRTRWLVATACVLAAALASPSGAVLPFPAPPADPYDYPSYLYIESGDCSEGNASENDLPESFDCEGDWKYTDHRVPNEAPDETYDPLVANNPQELYGVKGTGVNRAWEVSTGRPDVVIAVLDSGIRWEDSARSNLLQKHYLNRFELPVPAGGPNPLDTRFGGFDVNGDGVFNVTDYAGDARVADLNGNGVRDPEDLIRTFSDGTDADRNGYVDDISGWDFFENDNNPQDDTDYGHGTGEAEDSVGEAGLEDGQCPNCMGMSLRVGDSFIADVNHWAEAVVYAVDNGVSVVQEALGTLNHTSFGQAAADYAYRNGVIINASEADEAAGHHNWPAAYDHTMVVNSIRTSGIEPAGRPNSYLYFNGCTNFGAYTYVAIPSTSCSSEATGRSAGVSGLLYSAAKNAIERGEMTTYIRDDGTRAPFPISAEEAMQLWRLSADDIDFSSSCAPPAPHDFCDDAPPDVPVPQAPPNNYATTIPDSTRYQSVKGWDFFFGYGRSNAARLVRYIGRPNREYVPDGPYGVGEDPALDAQDRIPPEADISSPPRWRQYGFDADGNLLVPDDPSDPDAIVVRGRVAANRVTTDGGTFDWILEWAPQAQGQKSPISRPAAGSEERSDGPWTVAAQGSDLTAAFEGELGRIDVQDVAAAIQASPPPWDPATDPTSEFLPERFAVRLRLRVVASPASAGDTVNNEAVHQKHVDVYSASESILRYDLGVAGRAAGGAGAPSFHDLDGDGDDELLLPTEDGVVHAYTNVATGEELSGWPVQTRGYPGVRKTGRNAYTRGAVPRVVPSSILLGSLAVADLDDDGRMEVAIGDLDGRLYVWQHDGTLRKGFPVTVNYQLSREPACTPKTIPACDDYAPGPSDPGGIRDRFNDRDWGINSAPAIGNLDPRTPGLEIVVGANDGHVYAWRPNGRLVAGWPVFLRDPEKVAEMDPATHHVVYAEGSGALRGTKVLVSPSLGDIDVDGDLEVVLGVNEEYEETPNIDPTSDPLTDALAQAGIGPPGNTRIYALHHEGFLHPQTAETLATPHTQDQAYAPGWPVPIAMLDPEILPYVGEGTNSQAALANITSPADPDPELEVAIASAAGPGYVLNHDGSSFYGNGPTGRYRGLSSAPFGAGSTAQDQPSFVAVGSMALGSLDGGQHMTIAGPGAGVRRALDIVVPADQLGAEDHLLMWNGMTGRYEENAPITVNDLQFFVQPIVADVTGDGLAEVVTSTAVSDVVAAGLTHTNRTAIRHHTGGWGVTAAALGDAPLGVRDDGRMYLAAVTREGWLRLWPTNIRADSAAACTALEEWPEYGHDAFNSGSYPTDAERPYPIRGLQATPAADRTVTLAFTATGDDRACGRTDRYAVRAVAGSVASPSWLQGQPVQVTADAPPAAGQPDEITAGPLGSGTWTLMVRAYDESGNGSAVRAVTVTIP